ITKNIAASVNIHGYNLIADNCYIKWTSFNIINDMLGNNPAIAPLSIKYNIRGFTINENVLHLFDST
ncbi:hypothetical protein ALC62_11051, partial [Cyphomyrmex costatus]